MKITVAATKFWPFAKRVMWLAWQACGGATGMGFLQNHPTATEDEVWAAIAAWSNFSHDKNAPGFCQTKMVNADYVFGRMMKLGLKFDGDTIEISDGWSPDYQSFCQKYPNAKALLDAASKSLGCIYAEVATAVEPIKAASSYLTSEE